MNFYIVKNVLDKCCYRDKTTGLMNGIYYAPAELDGVAAMKVYTKPECDESLYMSEEDIPETANVRKVSLEEGDKFIQDHVNTHVSFDPTEKKIKPIVNPPRTLMQYVKNWEKKDIQREKVIGEALIAKVMRNNAMTEVRVAMGFPKVDLKKYSVKMAELGAISDELRPITAPYYVSSKELAAEWKADTYEKERRDVRQMNEAEKIKFDADKVAFGFKGVI